MADWDDISTLAAAVASGERTALELVTQSHERISKETKHNAVIEVIEDRAITRAKEIDAAVKAGTAKGRLLGVPFIAKDNYLTFGSNSTASSNMLKDFKAPYQSEVIERLEAEGAICVAKANLDAFAHGASTENSDFGVTKNPVDDSRVAGGSSGGSAAAVALGLAPFALGSDTGGSIRQPASFCGVVGIKPTYGITPRFGVVAMASSTDVMGPLTANVQDAALVLDVMAGKSQLDGTTIDKPSGDLSDLSLDPKGLKIGVITEHMTDGVAEGVRSSVQKSVESLKAAGADVKEISIPSIDYALGVYYIVVPAEVSSNLGRYDAVKYGHSADQVNDLDELYTKSRAEGFNAENKRRILMGNYVLSSGYYDAYYKKAQKVRTLLIEEFNKALAEVDVLIGPACPTTAFPIGQNTEDPLQMYLSDIMTVSMSLVGVPAVSVPIAADEQSLPVGLQVTGRQGDDRRVLAVAKLVEEIQ